MDVVVQSKLIRMGVVGIFFFKVREYTHVDILHQNLNQIFSMGKSQLWKDEISQISFHFSTKICNQPSVDMHFLLIP